jgi:hypothetical protein
LSVAMTSATRSGSTAESPRNNSGDTAIRASITSSTTGAMFTKKALNDKPLRAPMMIFGGSPTRVAAPPMLEANTSAMRNGTGLISSRSHSSSVTGAINNTETTLGRMADDRAITSISRIMMRSGEPLERLTAQIAAYSNAPVWRMMLTMIIMPSIKKMTSQSIPLFWE